MNDEQPTLRTARLILRAFVGGDADTVQAICSDPAIADTTATIPHPYPAGGAAAWIATHGQDFTERSHLTLAMTLRRSEEVIGAISLGQNRQHESGLFGYWVSARYWNQGYCTEATQAVIDYAFAALRLHRVESYHFARNAASGRVMVKVGMTYEGTRRQAFRKGSRFEDLVYHSILRTEWEKTRR